MSQQTPTVAIVGATGFVGNLLTEAFLQALKEDRINAVRVLTTKKSEKTKKFQEDGAQVFVVNFSKKETLLAALKSVDIVVSAMGTGDGSEKSRSTLLEAMVQSGVDVYFPSEFGTNHYSARMKFKHSAFEGKKDHFNEAKLKPGLKVVRLVCSMIMEYTFGSWCGLDCETRIWKIPGNGNTLVGVSASRDIGRFTVEAALLALKEPGKVSSILEIVSDVHTLKEYAAILDKVSGKTTKFLHHSLQDSTAKFIESKGKNFVDIFPLLFETGANSITPQEANGNNLLNPGENLWSLKKFEEYAEETGGKPVPF